jgi:uncharacterized protein (TIGR01777 family)
MSKKIIITGATGLIGSKLCRTLVNRGDELTIFTRNVRSAQKTLGDKFSYVKWNYETPDEWANHLEDKDAIIHLAGANLFAKRWTAEYKKLILESRELSTRNLVLAIGSTKNKIKDFISSSAVGYYGSRDDELLTEDSKFGNDYLSHVCDVWESEAEKASKLGIRTSMLRQGIVLSNEGGALNKMLFPFRFFIGGSLGSGQQWFPWIHIDDLIEIYLFILDNAEISGAVNVVSPESVRMNEFVKTLGSVLNRPSIFKVPEFVLRVLVGEAASTIVSSQRVIPKKLIDHGFKFKFEKLHETLENLLRNNSRLGKITNPVS